ncbi:MAG: YdcF family protein [Lachnospiraceae bacterium]|nr:YdcF family protein [Lachnospiraceae bacterium]
MRPRILRIILIAIGLITTTWFILPKIIFDVLNIGNMTGIIAGLFLIIFGIFISPLSHMIKRCQKKKAGKAILTALSACVLIPVLTAIILSAFMLRANLKKPEGTPTLVVLGCRVIGHTPSLVLSERLNAAYNYLISNPDSYCIVSGGQGSDEMISEAQCMHDWLINRGIAKERILVENNSTSTRENLTFSGEILKENGLSSDIAIVTNEFHMHRAHMIAHKLGLKASAIPARTNIILYPTYVVREWYGILYELLGLN